MATTKEEFQAKIDRHEAATKKTREFIAAGGDRKSEEGMRLGLEMIQTLDELRAEFERPFLKDISPKSN